MICWQNVASQVDAGFVPHELAKVVIVSVMHTTKVPVLVTVTSPFAATVPIAVLAASIAHVTVPLVIELIIGENTCVAGSSPSL